MEYSNQSDTDKKQAKTQIRIQISLLYETLQGEWCRAAIPKISAPKRLAHNSQYYSQAIKQNQIQGSRASKISRHHLPKHMHSTLAFMYGNQHLGLPYSDSQLYTQFDEVVQ